MSQGLSPYTTLTLDELRALLLEKERQLLDVAELNARLEASREEVEFQRSLLTAQGEAALDGILVVNPAGKIISFNSRFVQLWELPPEIVTNGVDEFVLAEVMKRLVRPDEFLAKVLYLYEHPAEIDRTEILLNDGRVFDRYSAPVNATNGRHFGRVWYFREITQQKRDAHLLLEQRNQLSLAMEIAEIGSWNLLVEKTELIWSPSLKVIFGLPKESPIPHFDDVMKMIHPDDREKIQNAVASSIKDRTPGAYEYRIVRPDGSIRFINARSRNFYDAEGNVVELVGIAQDVTTARQSAELLVEQDAKLLSSSKLSALGEMAGGIAHEINNPLAVIHTLAGQLKDEATIEGKVIPPARIVLISDRIEATAMRISKIIRSLRAFARDGDHAPLEMARVAPILEDSFELCRARFRNHGIDLKWDTVPDNLTLYCRPIQLAQVLLNLLNNAHDAIADLPEKWIHVGVAEAGANLEISVTDSGHGISEAVRARMMDPFFTTKEIGKGTGLGLSVSKGIVDTHHGSLSVDVTCVNTRFVISIPRDSRVKEVA